jgi:hypothetical protein
MVTISSYQNLLRLDAAPTEVQMKLGISQVLSMPFAYNSPVIVLDFEVGNKNIIKGRFKDAIRSRVFEFEIGDSITFKPFTWRRTDSDVDPMAWEDFSKGYCYRFDAVKTVRKEKPKCGNTSYNCGKACIGLNKNCKSDPPDKPSQEKVDKLRAAAGEFKAVQGDPTKKQEDNKLTPKPQEVKEVAPTPSPDKAEVPVTDLAKQPPVALKIGKKSVNLKDDLDSYKDLRITADPVLGWQVINKNGNVLREPPKGNTAPSHRFKKREQAEKFANDVMTRVEKLQKAQPKPDADVSDSDKRSFESLYTTKLSSAQQLLNLEKNAKIARISPSEDQKNYDKKQPDLNIDSGPGIMEGWRTAKPDGSVQGIPWSVKAEGQEKSRAIVGARLTDHPASPNLKRLRLYDADGRNETIDFKKGDRNASLRARRLVREIAQGKSQEMESGDIKALIEGGKEGLAKRKVEKARLAAEDKQFKAALDDYLKSKNLTRESLKGLTDIGMDDLIEKVEKYQKSQSQTPNSTGVKGAGGKTVDQQYKDIIASSKDPKGTEEAISEALADTLDFEKKTYERYLTAQKNGTVPKGYEEHYQKHIDKYKPVIEAEQFLKERRKKALAGDFETEAEIRPYGKAMIDKYGKDYDYYDSQEYAEKREKLKSIVGEAPLPPVLSGKIPAKDLRQTLKPGDKLLRKQATYGYAGSSSGNTPTGWKYSDGGEVAKVAIKNVSTKINYGMGDRMFDDSVSMRDVTHVIRDGKRYKVDDSDSSPNDLKSESSKSQKAVKQKAVKQKAIKVQGERSPQESPLVPKEEIVKEAPKRIGDGTHDSVPRNAQEYYDAMVKKGEDITIEEAEKVIKSVKGWITDSDDVRDDQKAGKSNKNEENINRFMESVTPYNGEISRGILFDSREEVEAWLKGDENGVISNQGAHSSWTSDYKVAYDFSKASYKTNPSLSQYVEGAYPVIIKAQNKTGVPIKNVGLKPQESEVIISKNTKHKIKKITEENDIITVEVEEI